MNSLIARAMRRDGINEVTAWADLHGIPRSTFYALVRGRTNREGKLMLPSIDTLVTLAKALAVPTHELLYLLVPDAPGAPDTSRYKWKRPLTMGTALELTVESAGWFGTPDPFVEVKHGRVYVEMRFAANRELRAFKVAGDSMTVGDYPIHDGDIVLVDASKEAENADAVVARLKDDLYVCKVLKRDKFGELLQSRNVDHTNGTPSVIYRDEVAELVGPVVRVIMDTPAATSRGPRLQPPSR